jgi:hypothetical protein
MAERALLPTEGEVAHASVSLYPFCAVATGERGNAKESVTGLRY